MTSLFVLQAAIRHGDLIYTMPRPARHGNIMNSAARAGKDGIVQPDDQGFLLSDGTFADRKQAMEIALQAGQQILRRSTSPTVRETPYLFYLFSEDLW